MKSPSLMLLLIALMWACLLSPAVGADVLASVNARRAYLGLPAFKRDAELTRQAEWSAYKRSKTGVTGHFFRMESPARLGGVGFNSKRDLYAQHIQNCYSVTVKGTYAGAAARIGRNGTYYAIFVRY